MHPVAAVTVEGSFAASGRSPLVCTALENLPELFHFSVASPLKVNSVLYPLLGEPFSFVKAVSREQISLK